MGGSARINRAVSCVGNKVPLLLLVVPVRVGPPPDPDPGRGRLIASLLAPWDGGLFFFWK